VTDHPPSAAGTRGDAAAPAWWAPARTALGVPVPLALAVLAVALALPAVTSGYWVRVLSSICMFAAMAQSLNIMAGFMGYADFGNTVFFGLGAYTTAVLTTKAGLPVVPAVVAGALVGVALASLMGLPLLRLRGHYFAIATIGVLEAAREIIANVGLLGGGLGITLPLFPGAPEVFYRIIYYLLLGVLLAYTGIAWWLSRSKFGYALRAIKADLVLEAVARREDIQVTPEELGREIAGLASALGRDQKDLAKSLDRSGQVVALAGDIIRSKALDLLVEHADIHSDAGQQERQEPSEDPADAPTEATEETAEETP